MRTTWFRIAPILCFGAALYAQTFGSITGEVRDAQGATVPAAEVTLINADTNVSRKTVTNEEGLYSFPSVPPGRYDVRVSKSGFKSTARTAIEIQVQQNARIDFDLTLGQVSETVEVNAAAQLLSTENATVGTVIENKRIVELPLNGRNYLQLVSLSPNVSYGFGSAGQAGSRQGGERASQNIAVSGQRSYFNQFSLDGVNNTDPNFNTYIIQPSIDALQEFSRDVLTRQQTVQAVVAHVVRVHGETAHDIQLLEVSEPARDAHARIALHDVRDALRLQVAHELGSEVRAVERRVHDVEIAEQADAAAASHLPACVIGREIDLRAGDDHVFEDVLIGLARGLREHRGSGEQAGQREAPCQAPTRARRE